MKTIQRIIEGVDWVSWGDVLANVIEPHFGHSLRKLKPIFIRELVWGMDSLEYLKLLNRKKILI